MLTAIEHHSLLTANPKGTDMPETNAATGHCHACYEPLQCQPDGHHCHECGFHDDVACVRAFNPDELTFPGMPATIVLPRDAFDAIVAVYRRRDAFRWAALVAPKGSEMPRRILELAAALAAGSTRLTPETAYKLGLGAATVSMSDPVDTDADDAYRTVRMLIPAEILRELDIADEAEQAAVEAEYIAWKAAQ